MLNASSKVLVVGAAIGTTLASCGSEESGYERVAARVAGTVITRGDVERRRSGGGGSFCASLDRLVDEALLVADKCTDADAHPSGCVDADRRRTLDEVVQAARSEPSPADVAAAKAESVYLRSRRLQGDGFAKNLVSDRTAHDALERRASRLRGKFGVATLARECTSVKTDGGR